MRLPFQNFIHIFLLITAGGTLFAAPLVWVNEASAWKLKEALHLPKWFFISGEHRVRYETLSQQFRFASTGSDQILSLRTLVQGKVRFNDSWELKLELQDSRAELADSGSRMNNSIVNASELLEANLVWQTGNLFHDGSENVLRAGRFTLDLGKRRFVARNRFRNVIQSFSGLDWEWTAREGFKVRTLLTLPVNRQPAAVPQLLRNAADFDEESLHQIFWGTFVNLPEFTDGHKGEVFFFALHEDDANKYQTRNRELYIPGFRVYRPRKSGQWDYELESIYQFGTVRATTSELDTKDLDHFAHLHHVEVGYSIKSEWRWRMFVEYDYASGDRDPNDGNSDRFERLFGPNVADFGPTSIHTAFVRANISSPGARVQVRPLKNIYAYLSYRAYWLASKRDGWQGASGLRDVTGNSGSFLGHQILMRSKWKAHPNLKIEGGVAYRIDGEFPKSAPGSPRQGNSVYSYISTTLSF